MARDADKAAEIMRHRLPMGVAEAKSLGFIDAHFGADPGDFLGQAMCHAGDLAKAVDYPDTLAMKRARRSNDEEAKSLASYRAEELKHMQRNFYGFDPSYHVARHHFVDRTPHSWTPRHLARHRELGWRVPED